MTGISILNDVLGPVMRGPSSSHTAASFHLGVLARSLLGRVPATAQIAFDSAGSYAKVYRQQGSDLAFAAGLMGWPITDPRFPEALKLAPAAGLSLGFREEPLPEADHPNSVRMTLADESGPQLVLIAKSIGGGAVEVTSINGWPVRLDGSAHQVLVEIRGNADKEVAKLAAGDGHGLGELVRTSRDGHTLLTLRRALPLAPEALDRLVSLEAVQNVWEAAPLMFVKWANPLFTSAAGMIELAEAQRRTAGQIGLAYEARLLGISEPELAEEMARRAEIMVEAVHSGLQSDTPPMQLLRPTAGRIYLAEAQQRVAIGGMHTRAAARAMAAMHVNCAMGVVCAAPTAGSAGVLPGVTATLLEERNADAATVARSLFAAGIVGVIVAERATFAAEVAGCQVEIGAAGAMAAAAVVEAAGGSARQAADAAAVCFQNTMGMVCDLVQGIVEIPCHTRNAVAASSAFVVADLILGGYENPIPLDETIDAVYAVGQMLPPELRVTSLGGLAIAPSALAMKRLR